MRLSFLSRRSRIVICVCVQRRKTKKWTRFEEENIIKGIGEFGEGNWKDILLAYEFQSGRTTVDIKDKWRNMARRRRQTE